MNPIHDTLDSELVEYSKLLDSQFISFQKNNEYCCKALTNTNLQCKNIMYKAHLLCKLHRKKKYSPDYIIVYIHNDIQKNRKKNYNTNNETHIIAYPYKNKEKYNKDSLIYKKELQEDYIQNLIKVNQITTCKVCNDTFTNNELIKCTYTTCDNKHLICSSCLSGYIDSQIANNIGTYECMFHNAEKCNGEYKPTLVHDICDKDSKLSKWKELVTITDIYKLSNVCDNYIICPLCRSWGCILDIEPGNTEPMNVKCLNCNLEWCNLCKREAHRDASCYKLVFTETETLEKRISIIDTMIQNIMTKILTHTCSTCSSAYIKEDGCNLMYCSRCGGMSCYICNTKIYYKPGKSKYYHFVGHEFSASDAVCPIWNNNFDDNRIDAYGGAADVAGAGAGAGAAAGGAADVAGAGAGAGADGAVAADKIKQGNIKYNTKKIITELILFLANNHTCENVQQLIYNRIRNLYEKDEEYKIITEEFLKLDIK